VKDVEEIARACDLAIVKRLSHLDVYVMQESASAAALQRADLGERYKDKFLFADLLVPRWQSKRAKRDPVVAEPTDPMYPDQFHHSMIRTPQAWQFTRGKGASFTFCACKAIC
jgi:hypothetical protein